MVPVEHSIQKEAEFLAEGETPKYTPYPALHDRDRITVNLQLHHQHRGDQPTSVSAVAMLELPKCEEQSYVRRISVGNEWMQYDLSWFVEGQPGMLCLENMEGRSPLVNPTDEEKAEVAEKLIEVSLTQSGPHSGACWLIYPGWPFFGVPSDHTLVYLRCRGQQPAKCKVTIFPK